MSITFRAMKILGDDTGGDPDAHFLVEVWQCDCEDYCNECYKHRLNVANQNGRELLRWLGILDAPDLCGEIEAHELAARCRRRLWDVDRNHDPELSSEERAEAIGVGVSPRVIVCSRPANYLHDKVEQLLFIAEYAGDNMVAWS